MLSQRKHNALCTDNKLKAPSFKHGEHGTYFEGQIQFSFYRMHVYCSSSVQCEIAGKFITVTERNIEKIHKIEKM